MPTRSHGTALMVFIRMYMCVEFVRFTGRMNPESDDSEARQ